MRRHFRLDPDVIFLNHGSFGATPRPVLRAANRFRKQMERQPVRFFQQELPLLGEEALNRLGAWVGGESDLVFVPNATYGVNIVAASLAHLLKPDDEVLGTTHEYGACANAWEAACARSGATYVRCPIALPNELDPAGPDAREQVVAQVWAGVTERTRVLFLSHITSPTAQQWPIEPLVARARSAGILTVIDGAHAPGMIPLDMQALGVDFYTANCHKWLSAPKSAGFLYARPEVQHLLRPLVVSWGSAPERQFDTGRDFRDAFVWAGTLDYSAYLAVPAAIDFQERHRWDTRRAHCSALLQQALPRLARAAGMAPIYAGALGVESLRPPQLAISPLPAGLERVATKERLLNEFRIEIPVISWRNGLYLRISVQAYNTERDLKALEYAVECLTADASARLQTT
jgi:isopenicillin-N epimerase